MNTLHGVGIGLRREFIDDFLLTPQVPDFFEIAPENWMNFGGRHPKILRACLEKAPLICHGLSLSIGGPQPLNLDFIRQIKKFINQYDVSIYSEHLSYTQDEGQLYDLLPIPMTEEAVKYVSERILKIQDILGRHLVLENVSTYLMPQAEMSEAEFVAEVIAHSDCELLLDVNNVYVNSINHGSDAYAFINQMPINKIRYIHVAGHYQLEEDLLIDTHGDAVCHEVWDLLAYSYRHFGVQPTLLERDFNIPNWQELQQELLMIKMIQEQEQSNGLTADQSTEIGISKRTASIL